MIYAAKAFLYLCAVVAVTADYSPLLPYPYVASLGNSSVTVDGSFQFTNVGSTNTIIDAAITRYGSLLSVPSSSKGTLYSCSLSVSDVDTSGSIVGSDESHKLTISESGECSISAETTWGLLHGLESFTQLLTRSSSGDIELAYAPVAIEDKPRFSHRGLMIDSARHYLPVETIRRVIDTLPMSKFNVLHWHTVDAESFPLDSPSEPMMVNGAYSSESTYTMANLKDLTAYAKERGIEIIYELDVPGHAAGWVKGKPELIADCMKKYTNINNYALNPTLEDTYTTLQGLLGDIVKATGTNRLHIGGDEVIYGCWSNDASITAFMKANNMSDYTELYTYFVTRADGMIRDMGASVTHWEEVFTYGCTVDADTTFQVWTDSSVVSQITAANYNVIASPSNYWYLNIQTNTWQVMYSYEPYTDIPSSQQKLIIGGETALWGEYVDEVNIEQSLYPRASAAAERLWSQAYVTDQTSFLSRLEVQRCRLLARGFQSAPVAPSFCSTQYV